MAELLLVRHGQASLFAEDYDRLSELGAAQSAGLGRALAAWRFVPDAVFTGGMRRHRETSEACLAALGCAVPPVRLAGFDEYDHVEIIRRHEPRYATHAVMMAELRAAGDARGAFARMFTAAMTRWAEAADAAEYAESWDAFHRRVERAITEAFAALPENGRGIVFTSGGAIASACRGALGLDDPRTLGLMRTIANGSVTRLRARHGRRTLVSLNETGFLEAAGLTSLA